MMRSALVLLIVAAGLWLPQPTHGQGTNDTACRDVLVARAQPTGTDNCLLLANYITTQVTMLANDIILATDDVISARDLQPRIAQQAALAGTAAQGDAVPSVQPAGVASGTIAAIGTDAGQDAIAALGLNPAMLFLANNAKKQLAKYLRFSDITVFVPVSKLSAEGQDTTNQNDESGPDYFGVRARLNFHGLSQGDDLWDESRTLLSTIAGARGALTDEIQARLNRVGNVKACADALLDNPENVAGIESACDGSLALNVDLEQAARLRAAFARIRSEVDSRYFGLDLRFDKGDPTLGAVENAAGTFLFAGVGYGRRVGANIEDGPTWGFRARLGVRHAKLDQVDGGKLSVDGAFGFEFARQFSDQQVNASAAFDFRAGGAPDEMEKEFQSDYGVVRGSLLLPVTAANSISVNVGVPLWGPLSPTVSVNFNWGLLLQSDQGGM